MFTASGSYRSVFRFGTSKYFFVLLIVVVFAGCGENTTTGRAKNRLYEEVVTQTQQSLPSKEIAEQNRTQTAANVLDSLFAKQWYLQKEGIDVVPVWKAYTGKGVRIGVVDSGIDANHPDLAENLDMVNSYRFSDASNDPSVTEAELHDPFTDAPHGTAVAGVIAAAHNGEGIIGVAPEATLVGLNVFSAGDDDAFASAMLYPNIDISSNSWGGDLSFGLDDDRIVLDAIEAKMQRDPTIFVFAAGNEASNTGFSSVLNSRYTLVVGALERNATAAVYSNFGTNLLCSAPGGRAGGESGIVTTDLVGIDVGYDRADVHWRVFGNEMYAYTDKFDGTSAAVPIVSGVIALMREANPSIDYRDVRYIIAHTAQKIESSARDWIINGEGLHYNRRYGFGRIDPAAATGVAKKFPGLGKEVHLHTSTENLQLPIPDNNTTGIGITLSMRESVRIEYVVLTIRTDHTYSGDLKISLHSPAGTSMQITDGETLTQDAYNPWSFGILGFMDENASGAWRVNVSDIAPKDEGKLISVTLDIYGVAI